MSHSVLYGITAHVQVLLRGADGEEEVLPATKMSLSLVSAPAHSLMGHRVFLQEVEGGHLCHTANKLPQTVMWRDEPVPKQISQQTKSRGTTLGFLLLLLLGSQVESMRIRKWWRGKRRDKVWTEETWGRPGCCVTQVSIIICVGTQRGGCRREGDEEADGRRFEKTTAVWFEDICAVKDTKSFLWEKRSH